jgi:phospholipid transport system transporter-binding protein
MNDARAATAPLAVARDGDTLVVTGALLRASVAAAWTRALTQVSGVRRIDLTGVPSVDSAGIALLAELAARTGQDVTVTGQPAGLSELRAAYRLDEALRFASA